MPIFELEFAAFFIVSASISAAVLYYVDFRSRKSMKTRVEGKIRLPEDGDEGDETLLAGGDEPYHDEPIENIEGGRIHDRGKAKERDDDHSGEEQDGKDPFNVTTPMDMVDGRPVDEKEFWSEVNVLGSLHLFIDIDENAADAS